MADKITDSPKQKGLKGVYTKFTQEAEGGSESYAEWAAAGMKTGLRASTGLGAGIAVLIGAVGVLEFGDLSPGLLDDTIRDAGLNYGLSGQRGYQAIRIDGQDVVLAKDGDDYRVYISQTDDGERELVLIEDRFEAFAHVFKTVSQMEDTLNAFETYDLNGIQSVPTVYKFEDVSLPYEYDGHIRRAVDDAERFYDENTPLNTVYAASMEQWRAAANDILSDGTAALQASEGMERPEQGASFFFQAMALVLVSGLGLGVVSGAGLAGGGMAISAVNRALYRREKRKRREAHRANKP
jgi:hypothetical protein